MVPLFRSECQTRAVEDAGVLPWLGESQAVITLLCGFLWRVVPARLRCSFCTRNYIKNLSRSLEHATEFAVSQPNDEQLWASVRHTIEGILYKEWQRGSLVGTTAKEAYRVRCHRTTITQDDLDNGRLVCEIGIAIVRPAEHVIIRIGQWTTDRPDP